MVAVAAVVVAAAAELDSSEAMATGVGSVGVGTSGVVVIFEDMGRLLAVEIRDDLSGTLFLVSCLTVSKRLRRRSSSKAASALILWIRNSALLGGSVVLVCEGNTATFAVSTGLGLLAVGGFELSTGLISGNFTVVGVDAASAVALLSLNGSFLPDVGALGVAEDFA